MKTKWTIFTRGIDNKKHKIVTATCPFCGYYHIDWQAKTCRDSKFNGLCGMCDNKTVTGKYEFTQYGMRVDTPEKVKEMDIIQKRNNYIEQMDNAEKNEHGEWKNREDFKREEI